MLQLSNAQFDMLAERARRDFEARLLDSIVSRYPEKVMSLKRAALQTRLSEAVGRAVAYGFDWEADVAAFVLLTFELGEHFDSDNNYSWVRPILEDRQQPGAARIEAIEDGLCGD